MASYRLITTEDAERIDQFLHWIRENINPDNSQQETFANGIMNASNVLRFGSGGIDTSDENAALPLQNVKASVLSDINKMIDKVEGWIDKDTSRRDKYLIHGQADGMRKAIHIIHQHLP